MLRWATSLPCWPMRSGGTELGEAGLKNQHRTLELDYLRRAGKGLEEKEEH